MPKTAFLTELTDLLNAGCAVHFAPLPDHSDLIIVVVSRGDNEVARQIGYPAIVSDLLGNAYMQAPGVRDVD